MAVFIIGYNIEFDPSASRLRRLTEPTQVELLNHSASLCLQAFIQQPGIILHHDHLLDIGWRNVVVTPNSLSQAIVAIRRAFKALGVTDTLIETIPKKGYRLAVGTSVKELGRGLEANSIPNLEKGTLHRYINLRLLLGRYWIFSGIFSVLFMVCVVLAVAGPWGLGVFMGFKDIKYFPYSPYQGKVSIFYQEGMDVNKEVLSKVQKLREKGFLKMDDKETSFIYVNQTSQPLVFSYFICPSPVTNKIDGCRSLVIVSRKNS